MKVVIIDYTISLEKLIILLLANLMDRGLQVHLSKVFPFDVRRVNLSRRRCHGSFRLSRLPLTCKTDGSKSQYILRYQIS